MLCREAAAKIMSYMDMGKALGFGRRWCRCSPVCHPSNEASTDPLPVLVNFRIPSVLQLLFSLDRFLCLSDLQLNPLSRSQNFALQIKTAPILRFIRIKHLLESFHHMFHVGLSAFGRRNVEDLACFFEGESRGCKVGGRPGVFCSRGGVFLRSLGLFVGFGEGTADYSGAGNDDLCYYSMRHDVNGGASEEVGLPPVGIAMDLLMVAIGL